jgi:hypothetical protein
VARVSVRTGAADIVQSSGLSVVPAAFEPETFNPDTPEALSLALPALSLALPAAPLVVSRTLSATYTCTQPPPAERVRKA